VSFADGLSAAVTLRSVTGDYGECRAQRLVLPGGDRSWTVLGGDHRPVGPAEEFLEYLRVQQTSPNTVKSYARALALWWQYLAVYGLAWDAVTLQDAGGFLAWLRTGDGPRLVSIERRAARFSESTIAARLQAVVSCYRYHQFNGVELGRDLIRLVHGRGGGYKPMLEHVARRGVRSQAVIRVRRPGRAVPPLLTPGQIDRICDACAAWDAHARQWRGQLRDRLLWSLLAETGLRLGEALGLLHCDWHAGCGSTAFIEVVPRDHPHGMRVKGGGYRRLYVSAELDLLYGEYVWQLCDAGADLAGGHLDDACVFVNLAREPRFAPWRPESVYDLVQRLRRELAGQVPPDWTPHWFRHSHATALLLAGVPVHVVSRRLGHADVQTTLNTYGHVTEDAELRAAADWTALAGRWLAAPHDDLAGACR
jgi:integrase